MEGSVVCLKNKQKAASQKVGACLVPFVLAFCVRVCVWCGCLFAQPALTPIELMSRSHVPGPTANTQEVFKQLKSDPANNVRAAVERSKHFW
jgi:hypothetical protein